jgi:hypothetical protein
LQIVNKNLINLPIFKTYWLILLAIAMRFLETNLTYSYIILAFYAFFGHTHAIQALVICFFLRSLNPNLQIITPSGTSTGFLSYLVILSSIFSIFFHLKFVVIRKFFFKISTFILLTFFFIFFLFFHGIFISQSIFISITKIILWSSLSVSLLLAFYSLSIQETLQLKKSFFWFFLILILISFILHFIPSIGYSWDKRGLNGIFYHPQIFGAVVSLFSSIVFIILLQQKHFYLKTFFLLILFILCFILSFISASRTAYFSLLFSILTFMIYSIFLKKEYFFKIYNIFNNKTFKISIITILLVLIILSYLHYEEFLIFIKKGYDVNSLTELYFATRSVVIDPLIENIKSKWLTGIGFGLTSKFDPIILDINNFDNVLFFLIEYRPQAEKGLIFLLVLEELGIIGLLIFVIWLISLISRTILSGNNIELIIIFIILFTNLGEAVLFAPGGLGLLFIILIFWAGTRSNQRSTKKEPYEKFYEN